MQRDRVEIPEQLEVYFRSQGYALGRHAIGHRFFVKLSSRLMAQEGWWEGMCEKHPDLKQYEHRIGKSVPVGHPFPNELCAGLRRTHPNLQSWGDAILAHAFGQATPGEQMEDRLARVENLLGSILAGVEAKGLNVEDLVKAGAGQRAAMEEAPEEDQGKVMVTSKSRKRQTKKKAKAAPAPADTKPEAESEPVTATTDTKPEGDTQGGDF